MTSAVIVAAGSSRRMGFDKLFAELAGKPVLARSIEAFANHPEVSELIVVSSAENLERIQQLLVEIPNARVILGGTERCHSVRNGLNEISAQAELVSVHDGARPLIHEDSISACLERAHSSGAAACARRVTETVKRADETGRVVAGVDRENLWTMETPQCFRVELLRRAYDHVVAEQLLVTDEVSAIEALGEPVFLVENPHPNPKITYPSDLDLATRLLESSS
ncbi:MAG: 2-C-methyl-D-erythritol 4-phosphate cytidylyltransferase [Verrucomicrobiales bacterium]|jgi:2-C-methyl-D-erythritol 4-phosphate cytidylyltransferase